MEEYRGIEKRRSPRVSDGIKVRMVGETLKIFGRVMNASLHGVLVRTKKYFCPEEEVSLLLYLKGRARPIYARGRIVRTISKFSLWGFRCFEEVGIEFMDMSAAHQQILAQWGRFTLM